MCGGGPVLHPAVVALTQLVVVAVGPGVTSGVDGAVAEPSLGGGGVEGRGWTRASDPSRMATKLLPVAVASTAAAIGVIAGAGGRKSPRGKGAPDPAWAGSMHMVATAVESGDAGDRDGAVADSDEEAAACLPSPPPPATAHGFGEGARGGELGEAAAGAGAVAAAGRGSGVEASGLSPSPPPPATSTLHGGGTCGGERVEEPGVAAREMGAAAGAAAGGGGRVVEAPSRRRVL
ncbi:uncharacterized protein [Miscanthus floridulus]|uniref:uncharacterized protein n=1 Tax=Miscanthus floridulus TaxID=154761 RepID=UPI00345A726F